MCKNGSISQLLAELPQERGEDVQRRWKAQNKLLTSQKM